MSVIYLALPIALVLAIAAVFAFVWAVRNGQMDDLETPAVRMLVDDDGPSEPTAHELEQNAEAEHNLNQDRISTR